MDSWAKDEARQRLARWAEEGRAVSDLVPLVFEEQTRLRAAAEAAEVECVRLRQELTALRAELEALRRDRSEVADLIANSLSRLSGEALRRLRERPPAESGTSVEYRRARVLLVDDEPNFTGFVAEYLGDKGFDVLVASTGEEALAGVSQFRPHIVLLDMMMPGIGGMEALRRIKGQRPDMCVIVVTGLEDLDTARRALAAGAANYLIKPFTLDYLDSALALHLPGEELEPAEPEAAGEALAPAGTAGR
ncbi:MAG TPA: response regulator [Vicinamibacteria bacterium]